MASFEESLKQLESIIAKLEQGDLPLEKSVELFEKGIQLSDACKKDLETAEAKVQVLLKQKDGGMKPEAFPTADDRVKRGKISSQPAEDTDEDIPF